ncbi:MAG: hypothetical protein QF893_14515 [Alphaproteobacteria bacterium]|jgi:hypothetical protein|nr:hypothetical protein [Alphaproteobacteria bacterium]
MSETITIAHQFCGPPDSGNGGYVAGRLAAFIDGPAETTLRLPPPLGRPLAVRRMPEGGATLWDGEALVVEGKPAEPGLEPCVPVDFKAAAVAAEGFAFFEKHLLPTCFVCGIDRNAGDGLRIFPGKIDETGLMAAPWVPTADVADGEGRVLSEFIWAALDCPGGFAVADGRLIRILLGRFSARLSAPLRVGDEAVVMAWPMGGEGRKHFAGSAVFGPLGELVGLASATWIELKAGF